MSEAAQTDRNYPVVLFPVEEHGANRAYATNYLFKARRRSQPIYHVTGENVEKVLDAVCCAPLPLATSTQVAEAISKLNEAKRKNILARQELALAAWRGSMPLIEGEILRNDRFTVLTAQYGTHKRYTLAYHRETNLGELVVIVPGSRWDPETQDTIHDKPLAALGASYSDRTVDIVESSLQTLSMIAFACGPTGAVIGSTGLVLTTILQVILPGDHTVNLPKVLDEIVKQDLAIHQIENDMTKLLAYSEWMHQTSQKALTNKYTDKQQEAYKQALAEIRQNVANALDPGSALQQTLSDLRTGTYPCTPEFQVAALPAYAFGVSLDMLFAQIDILVDKEDATTWKSPKTAALVAKAKDHFDYIQKTIDKANSDLLSRQGGVSAVTESSYTLNIGTGGCPTFPIVYITDEKASDFPAQKICSVENAPDFPNSVVWYEEGYYVDRGCFRAPGVKYPDDCDPEGARMKYFYKLSDDYNFNGRRVGTLQQLEAKLRTIHDKYKPLTY